MHIPDIIIRFAVEPVIVVVPALIGTEFLIGTTPEGVATIETFPFHSTKVLIKIHKTIFKRVQTYVNDFKTDVSI